MIREIAISALLLLGSVLMLLSTIGVIRFRDTLCRAHALTKATTFAASLLLAALWLSLEDEVAGLKILLVISFTLLTIPLASHLVASLYYRRLYELDKKSDAEKKAKEVG